VRSKCSWITHEPRLELLDCTSDQLRYREVCHSIRKLALAILRAVGINENDGEVRTFLGVQIVKKLVQRSSVMKLASGRDLASCSSRFDESNGREGKPSLKLKRSAEEDVTGAPVLARNEIAEPANRAAFRLPASFREQRDVQSAHSVSPGNAAEISRKPRASKRLVVVAIEARPVLGARVDLANDHVSVFRRAREKANFFRADVLKQLG